MSFLCTQFQLLHLRPRMLRKRKKGKKTTFALKLDMNKAYDHVNWEFLFGMLRTMGFSQVCVDWIKQCVTTVSFSVSVNGKCFVPFRPACGLRQGDPLSPYFFILVAQAFSDGLEEFASANICRGISALQVCAGPDTGKESSGQVDRMMLLWGKGRRMHKKYLVFCLQMMEYVRIMFALITLLLMVPGM